MSPTNTGDRWQRGSSLCHLLKHRLISASNASRTTFCIESAALTEGRPGNSTASATNFCVFRLKRDLFGRSSIGVIATSRSAGDTDAARNSTYGVDGTFALSPSVTVNTYWAATDTQGLSPEHDIWTELSLDRGERIVVRGLQGEFMLGNRRYSIR